MEETMNQCPWARTTNITIVTTVDDRDGRRRGCCREDLSTSADRLLASWFFCFARCFPACGSLYVRISPVDKGGQPDGGRRRRRSARYEFASGINILAD